MENFVHSTNETPRKVFVVCYRHGSIAAAGSYGELVILSSDFMRKFHTEEIYDTFLPILQKSSKEDFILLSGLSVMNGIAMSIFALKHKRVNLLIHNKPYKRYEVRRIFFNE